MSSYRESRRWRWWDTAAQVTLFFAWIPLILWSQFFAWARGWRVSPHHPFDSTCDCTRCYWARIEYDGGRKHA